VTGALVGAVSCERCGHTINGGERFCVRCGILLVPAATGSILGTYSGMLGGVARASAGRRNAALVVDVAPVLLVAVGAIVLAASALLTVGVAVILAIVIALAYLAVELSALSTAGTSLGRTLLRLRTVDDLTGDPVGAGRLLTELVTARWGRRTVTSDLRLGRDPRSLAQPAVSPIALLVDHSQVPADARGRRTATPIEEQGPAESVSILLDTGERLQFSGELLVGRVPENRASADRGASAKTESAPQLFAWPDLSRSLSKTHALLEWSGTVLWVTDLQSANGSVLVGPDGDRQPLVPGIRGAATVGWTVELGERSFAVRPASGGGAE
jgi:hypothetical protein